MKLIIAGRRDFNDVPLLWREVDKINAINPIAVVICGMARGADSIGMLYATEHNIALIEMPADWNRFGKSAGYRRNEEMAKIANACICFWDGQSRGTKYTINIATQHGLPLAIVNY